MKNMKLIFLIASLMLSELLAGINPNMVSTNEALSAANNRIALIIEKRAAGAVLNMPR